MALSGEENVYVDRSSIHGLGLFAAKDFIVGEVILVRDESRIVTPEQPLREADGELASYCDWGENGQQVLLSWPERYINHSCQTNSFVRWVDGKACNFALQPIRTGEEITHNYCVNLA